MLPVVTPREMGAADRATIEAGTPQAVLMERAGRAVARSARRALGGTYGRRILVVCGKGNNGRDGLVAAAALRHWGVGVTVVELGDGFDRRELVQACARADLVIDAMFGTGFRGALEGDAAFVVECLGDSPPVVAVDIPSGVDGTTGAVGGPAVVAQTTVAFAARKPGLLLEPGASHAGAVEVVDIGVDVGRPEMGMTEMADVTEWMPAPAPDTNKWQSGLYVVAGSGGMTGAPTFVSHAAMRAGAGMIWLGVPGQDAARRASGSEVITKGLPATGAGGLAEEAAAEVLGSLDRFRALALGPGLGREDPTAAAIRRLVDEAPVPLVLDADGLNALAGDAGRLGSRAAPTVVTPHDGEYARLTGRPVGDDRVAAVRALAEETGAVALLKGPATLVADPGGRVAVNPTGGPWLATAGTGDVLTGIIGGFLARGMEPFHAAAAGAFVHGCTADVAGHTGLVAGDLVEALPHTLAEIPGWEA